MLVILLILIFDTQSTVINITTITDFDSYKYAASKYRIEESYEYYCISGSNICVEYILCNTINSNFIGTHVLKTYARLTRNETLSIEG